ncbi:MAG TPA: SDR family oxidoreductase [Geminicoccus sp.]|uniref:SDR family NAD(P)-dependent oxidoreductase n=1 Tax=Geminicoccus sp. TaxID=2024832 RepID=UPI002C866071|nr:SDR family oxidoreductase [Geminicoccus sp.]HWL67509.1 SDR family oxidoreductase [Geminicoccus sp.]
MEHAGRTALVTGATGGLGVAQSRMLAEAGARVLMLDVKGEAVVDELRSTLPEGAGELVWVACDLADPQGTKERAAALDAQYGGIDIVVNNAAINPLKAIDAYDLAEWQRVQDINATACVAIAQATVPSMKRKGFGQIVNITTVTLNGGWEDFTAYVGSKGTLLGLTRSMARELGKFGIRVNCISPGAIPTPLEQEVWADQIDSYVKFLIDHQALKYRGSADDIAHALMFLISDRARFVTGHNLSVDGGWWMH